MEYTHNRKNLVIRIVYYCLLACGILSFNIGEGIFKPIISSLSLILLCLSALDLQDRMHPVPVLAVILNSLLLPSKVLSPCH